MEIGYYPGCSLHASSRLYDVQIKLVLGELGFSLKELEDWNCCGATSASKTDEFLATALPSRNLGIADASGISELVIPCSACYSRMMVAQHKINADKKLKEEINSELTMKMTGKVKIRSILEILKPKVQSGDLAAKVVKKLKGIKAACYYGCLQTRFPVDVAVPDDIENPQGMEIVLKAIGAEALDWSYKTDCCGASAAVSDPDTSLALMARILREATARGANCFVTTCPLCQLNLDAYQGKVAEKYGIPETLPVYFITELIGLAMDQSPEKLKIDRHFVDAMGLLEKVKLV